MDADADRQQGSNQQCGKSRDVRFLGPRLLEIVLSSWSLTQKGDVC